MQTKQRPPGFYGGANKNQWCREAAKPRITEKIAHQYSPAKNTNAFDKPTVDRFNP